MTSSCVQEVQYSCHCRHIKRFRPTRGANCRYIAVSMVLMKAYFNIVLFRSSKSLFAWKISNVPLQWCSITWTSRVSNHQQIDRKKRKYRSPIYWSLVRETQRLLVNPPLQMASISGTNSISGRHHVMYNISRQNIWCFNNVHLQLLCVKLPCSTGSKRFAGWDF